MAQASDYEDWRKWHSARYLFSEQTKHFISELDIDLEKLLNSITFGMARSRAKERVIEAIIQGKVGGKWTSQDTPASNMMNEILSYPLARMIVSCVDDEYLNRRYALAEAENAAYYLQNEDDIEVVFTVGRELGLKADKEGGSIAVPFEDFVETTKDMSAKEWKLVNQDLRDGMIYLDKRRYIRILKEKIYHSIVKDLPVAVNKDIQGSLSGMVADVEVKLDELKDTFVEHDLGEVEEGAYPPCIKGLIKEQAGGKNLSHEARFALTSFLHTIGFDEEQIIAIFSKSPDFRLDLARYQIEHVIGKISSTEYTPPGCAYMKTGGLCKKPDSLCGTDWMNHPLTYYSYKKKKGED